MPQSTKVKTTVDAPVFGQTVVTTAGTRVQLATNTVLTQGIVITAKSGNSGNIFIGDVTVTSSNGYILTAGASVTVIGDNIAKIYIDSAQNGEGVSYIGG